MNLTEIIDVHRTLYDMLADEYETRASELVPVTKGAVEQFSRFLKPGGTVLDVGCGVGSAVRTLADRGFQASGIELSPRMAAYAQARNPSASILVGDFLRTEFRQSFDGVLAFAFIHLFPKRAVNGIFRKMHSVLAPNGTAHVSSTESAESKEGWFEKADYDKRALRFRKFWTEMELRDVLTASSFEVLDLAKPVDPFGKIWMDFVVRKA